MKCSVINQRWCLASFFAFSFLLLYHYKGTHLHLVTINVASLGSSGSLDNYRVNILLPGSSSLPEFSPKPVVGESVSTPRLNKTNPQEEKCDIFEGEWVYDPKSYPLYHAHQCPFLSDQVTCQKNGRPDSNFESWRWKPRGCETPR